MPYINEFSTNKGNQNLISDMQDALNDIEFVSPTNKYIRIDEHIIPFYTKAKDSRLKQLFVIDGSKFEKTIQGNISIGLININQCIINLPKMVSYLKNSFALPKEYQEIKEDITLNMIVSLKGLKDKTVSDEKDFFRMFFYKKLTCTNNKIISWLQSNNYPIIYEESLFDTYISLLNNITKINANTPCSDCKKAGHFINLKDFKNTDNSWKNTIPCKCNKKTCYITDLLQFYEQLNNEQSNESLTTQIMLVLEKLTLINLIHNLKENKLIELLETSAFILDGPLAVYSHAAWLSSAINEEFFKLKNQNNLLIIGVEKTGNFVEHFKKIDNFFKEEPLKNGMMYFLNDDYIKKYIKTYNNDAFYGEKNYFGKKLFYKNHLGKLFVINLSFEDESDKFLHYNERNSHNQINKIQRMDDLIMLLENFSSQSYSNALSFISMANEGAALSTSFMGNKLLNSFIENLILKKINNNIL